MMYARKDLELGEFLRGPNGTCTTTTTHTREEFSGLQMGRVSLTYGVLILAQPNQRRGSVGGGTGMIHQEGTGNEGSECKKIVII